MAISNEQAMQEFQQLVRTSDEPGFVKLRTALRNLSGPDQEALEKAIADFMTTDDAFDAAMSQRLAAARLPKLVQPGPAMSIQQWASQGEGAQR